MKIIVKANQFKTFVDAIPDEDIQQSLNKSHAYRIEMQKATEIDVDVDLDETMIKTILERLKESKTSMRGLENQLGFWARMLSDPNSPKILRLKQLDKAIALWLAKDSIKGWIFKVTGDIVTPYLVTGIEYSSGSVNTEPSVKVNLDINGLKFEGTTYGSDRIVIGQNALPGTVDEIMAANGFYHETPDLHEAYQKSLKRYEEVQQQVNEQFHIAPGAYRSPKGHGSTVKLTRSQLGINDDTLVTRHIRSAYDEAPGLKSGLPEHFVEIPLYTAHYVYLLETHETCVVPSTHMTDYVYDEHPEDKIVLPADHRRLIDILTNERGEIMEDVVTNKSGGNVIMLEGRPGLGKTLVAEIYSEKIKRPLYRMEAGLLGLDAVTVEKSLKKAYENAARWDAVALIDEADIYVRQRNNDMAHNAIVATMLISMERQTSLTFMATNRTDDIDDAILSRCIAVVRFRSPQKEDAKRIWRIQSDILGLNMDDSVIDRLVEHFATGDMPTPSGRDIRNLLKLVKRYQEGKKDKIEYQQVLDLAVFRRM